MNKRQKKKKLKTQPRPCPCCGRNVRVETWGTWHQIGCWSHGCDYGVWIIAKKKRNAVKGWNHQIENYIKNQEEK